MEPPHVDCYETQFISSFFLPVLRLQKFLADAGVASRRASEQFITEGRVSVNGQTVTALGKKVDPLHDHVSVDGKPIRAKRKIYLPSTNRAGWSAPKKMSLAEPPSTTS